MVASGLLTVTQAIPVLMGANVGTALTSTLVALAQSKERTGFHRWFAAATVHDIFNLLTVAVLLPLETSTHYLLHLSASAVEQIVPGLRVGEPPPPSALKALTKLLTRHVLEVDTGVITAAATATVSATPSDADGIRPPPVLKHLFGLRPPFEDAAAGLLALALALTLLCGSLALTVALLKRAMHGRIARWMLRWVNGSISDLRIGPIGRECKVPMDWICGYVAMLGGAMATAAVQSSSVITSILTPLVGVGALSLERMYPAVLGANLGTCVTGLIAAMAVERVRLRPALQVALAHMLFNLTGIFLWYSLWPLRPLPLAAARKLGRTAEEFRWFALVYVAFVYLVLPGGALALSLTSPAALNWVLLSVSAIGALAAALFAMQELAPGVLPTALRTWRFLPAPLRSLKPWDHLFSCCCRWIRCCCCCCCCCFDSCFTPSADRLIHDDPANHNPFELHPDSLEAQLRAKPAARRSDSAHADIAARQHAMFLTTTGIAPELVGAPSRHPPHADAFSVALANPALDGAAYAQQLGPFRAPGGEGCKDGGTGGFRARRSAEQFARLEEVEV